MTGWRRREIVMLMLAMLWVNRHAVAQTEAPPPAMPEAGATGLDAAKSAALKNALDAHAYARAEGLLLPEIEQASEPALKDKLLLTIASIYYLNHDDLNAAIAWKKAEAIEPLPTPLGFSLAMAYIGMGRRDWAAQQLQTLAAGDAKNALYPYWLGRLDYDRQVYPAAIAHFQQAIQLDPKMARAYDNLGLCLAYLGQDAKAIENFNKAIALDSRTAHPSPWPHINLAATLQATGDLKGAEANLRIAIQLDGTIASSHFQLGNVLDSMKQSQAAVEEYTKAANLDPHYAEPHFALARLYRRLGKDELARHEVELYTQLHHAPASTTSAP